MSSIAETAAARTAETESPVSLPPVPDRRHAGSPVSPAAVLRVRIHADNPNHHLWNNHGTWFLHYTVHPTPFTKERVRRSLGTGSLAAARERRDAFFAHWSAQAAA